MAICPVLLLNQINGIFYYSCVNCDEPGPPLTCSADHLLQCGCSGTNADCFAPPGTSLPGGGLAPHAMGLTAAKKAKAKPKAKGKGKPFSLDGHVVHRKLAAAGLAVNLPAEHPWQFPNASFNPVFEGEGSYHVVNVGGKDRYIRVVNAAVKPPSSLYHLTFRDGTPRLDPLPEVDLRVGQETDLPDGVKPRPMVAAGLITAGNLHVRLQRSGTKADTTVFHVVLKK